MKYIHSFIHQSKHTYILLYTSKSLPPFRPTIILNTSPPIPQFTENTGDTQNPDPTQPTGPRKTPTKRHTTVHTRVRNQPVSLSRVSQKSAEPLLRPALPPDVVWYTCMLCKKRRPLGLASDGPAF